MTAISSPKDKHVDNTEAPTTDRSAPRPQRRWMRNRLPELAVPSLLVLTFVVFGILTPDLFLTWTNIEITLTAQATVLLLAMAVTLTLRVGDIDLSVAATMILSATLVGILYKHGTPAWAACVVGLACGIAVGVINCIFVIGVGLDSLIVTLGVFTAIGGFTSYLTNSNLVTSIPKSLQDFTNHPIFGLPVEAWIGWVIAAILWVSFEFTPLGRFMLFIGGNRAAGILAGLRVNRLRVFAFIGSAAISAVAGVLLAGSLGSVDPSSANAYLLAPVTAAFLGTTCIQLGRFNVVGTLVGLYLIAFGITGLQLLGYQGWVTDVFNGVALVVALSFARYFDALRSGMISFRRRGSAPVPKTSVEKTAAEMRP